MMAVVLVHFARSVTAPLGSNFGAMTVLHIARLTVDRLEITRDGFAVGTTDAG